MEEWRIDMRTIARFDDNQAIDKTVTKLSGKQRICESGSPYKGVSKSSVDKDGIVSYCSSWDDNKATVPTISLEDFYFKVYIPLFMSTELSINDVKAIEERFNVGRGHGLHKGQSDILETLKEKYGGGNTVPSPATFQPWVVKWRDINSGGQEIISRYLKKTCGNTPSGQSEYYGQLRPNQWIAANDLQKKDYIINGVGPTILPVVNALRAIVAKEVIEPDTLSTDTRILYDTLLAEHKSNINKTNTTNHGEKREITGRSINIPSQTPTVTRGQRPTGNSVCGRGCRTAISLGHLSYQTVAG